MHLQYCSDLHLEFPANKAYIEQNPITPEGDILILAGDIIPFAAIDKAKAFFDFTSDNFQHTYWIPGNHEYYRWDIAQRSNTFQENIRPNVTVLNNTAVEHLGVRLLFSTLWSRIDESKALIIQKSMADFRLIRHHGQKLSIETYNALHDACYTFLTTELNTATNKPTVVVSHHIPTALNYPEKYRHSDLNSAFMVELQDLIATTNANYWIHGHSHEVVPDFTIGNTILTSNQLGYIEHNEHHAFRTRTITL